MLARSSCRFETCISGSVVGRRGTTRPSAHLHLSSRGGTLRQLSQASSSITPAQPPTEVTIPRRLVLAVESSADDSCCAIVSSERKVLANVVIKQHAINAEFGGINPLLAQKAHEANVPTAVGQALREANLTMSDIDTVAYTRGPGMRACLTVGAVAARTVAAVAGKPCLGVHHMQAHALTPLLTETKPPLFPFLVLLVSGGHTQIVLAQGITSFRIVLDKLDLSVGAAFDKVARYLRLPHSASVGLGPTLERFAAMPPLSPYDRHPASPLPVPLSKNTPAATTAGGAKWAVGPNGQAVGFSFGGLQTAAQRLTDKLVAESYGEHASAQQHGVPEAVQREVSRLFQNAAVAHLCQQARKVIAKLQAEEGLDPVRIGGVVASGGVASNRHLRKELAATLNTVRTDGGAVPAFYPPIELCTDNAAMIAWAAILRTGQAEFIESDPPDLPILPKWSLEDLEREQ